MGHAGKKLPQVAVDFSGPLTLVNKITPVSSGSGVMRVAKVEGHHEPLMEKHEDSQASASPNVNHNISEHPESSTFSEAVPCGSSFLNGPPIAYTLAGLPEHVL